MNLTLIAFGTRGDVQPCIALARGLRSAGHLARIAAPQNFRGWVESHGVTFAPIGVDVEAMMRSPEGVRWVEGGRMREVQNMRALFHQVAQTAAKDMLSACEGAEVIVGGLTADWAGIAIAEKLGARYVSALLQPARQTRSGPASMMALFPRRDSIVNWITNAVSGRALFSVFGEDLREFRARMGLPALTTAEYQQRLNAAATLHGFSQHVVPRPADYPPHWHITGFWFLDEPDWQPPADLVQFLASGEAPVYIGFGSATDGAARRTTELILQAQRATGQRMVLYGGWAGLNAVSPSTDVHLLRGAPHSWLFPRMRAIVHHGGAGTTAAAVRAGAPQIVVPHSADQPYWARRMHALGVAAPPLPKQRLTAPALTAALSALIGDRDTQSRAAALGERVRAENGVATAAALLAQIAAQRA